MRGTGRAAFTAFLLLFVGTLNIFYGIGALGDAHVFVGETRLVFDNLHTYGWVLLILAAIELTGGVSLLAGNAYGRVIGIIAASLGALSNLTSIGGNDPWWRLGGFVLCVYILYGLVPRWWRNRCGVHPARQPPGAVANPCCEHVALEHVAHPTDRHVMLAA